MPPRKKVTAPQEVGFYMSISEYQAKAYSSTESISIYVRTHIGQWYSNGVLVSESALPADLWRLRPEQK
ncbi:hypothetical protein SEA_BIG4_274 [Microbacterium phage Big4]|nr:hypothetical protein SEA_BIG4_274 [Microbacterium phage Big4]